MLIFSDLCYLNLAVFIHRLKDNNLHTRCTRTSPAYEQLVSDKWYMQNNISGKRICHYGKQHNSFIFNIGTTWQITNSRKAFFLRSLKKASSICFVLTLIKLHLIMYFNYSAQTTVHMKYPIGKNEGPHSRNCLIMCINSFKLRTEKLFD